MALVKMNFTILLLLLFTADVCLASNRTLLMVTHGGKPLDSRHLPRMLTRALGTSLRLSREDMVYEECLTNGDMVEDLSAIGVQIISSSCHATVAQISNYMKKAEEALGVVTLVEPDSEVYLQEASDHGSFARESIPCGVNPSLGTNDPESGCQTNLETIGASTAWDMVRKLKRIKPLNDVVVAVIDSGVDFMHPDLVNQLWRDPVDGSIGYNFIENNKNVTDLHGHGTRCAGIIAAGINNSIGVASVAGLSNVKLMILRFLNENNTGLTSNALRALDFAVARGVQISSNSHSTISYSQTYQEAIVNAAKQGHVFVTVSGNGGLSLNTKPFYPCSFTGIPSMLCTGATTSGPNITIYNRSNFGPTVNILAPGVNILTTTPGGYRGTTGTSAAGPHVAATAAILASIGLKGQEITDAIIQSGRHVLNNQPPVLNAGEAAKNAYLKELCTYISRILLSLFLYNNEEMR